MPTFNPRATIDQFRQMVASHELVLNRYQDLSPIEKLRQEAQATSDNLQAALESMARIEAIWNAAEMNALIVAAMAGDPNAAASLAPLTAERWAELQAVYYHMMAAVMGDITPAEGVTIPVKTVLYRGGNPKPGWGILPQPDQETPAEEEQIP